MKDSAIHTLTNPVEEARRYVRNAKDLLTQNGDLDYETQYYRDRKYVRIAGNTLWNGVLLILDATFHIDKMSERLSIHDYRSVISQRDQKLLTLVNHGYDTMHLAMGYDGNLNRALCQEGFNLANQIIDRCAAMLIKVA